MPNENLGNNLSLPDRVLIVEDSRALQFMMTTLLKNAVAEVEVASDGRQALAIVESSLNEKRPFTVIFMDMQMPGMDGYEATQALRKQGITTPVIAITGRDTDDDRQMCLRAGCTEYLPKPVGQEELVRVIRKLGRSAESQSTS